ncbi:hypothetical protein JTE90_016647 [Oedothorax gibbosus]|uniref:Uncharacterized protein n=1 Tax=Oedothorax gibbosus TaxID=931172 RepID=A0AAV6TYB5_9ARAC|nr:hypothetical protein JTE90_016647 [Oedothorax gibbosus]
MERTMEAERAARAKMSQEEKETTQALYDKLSYHYFDATDYRTARERIKNIMLRVPCLSLHRIKNTIKENDYLDPAWIIQLIAEAEKGFPDEPQVVATIQPLAETMELSSDAQSPTAGNFEAEFPGPMQDFIHEHG